MEELQFAIRRQCGQMQTDKRPSNLVSLLDSRMGITTRKGDNFTNCDMRKISNDRLPDKYWLFSELDSKLFCGIFSNDGERFAVVGQDHSIRLYDSSTEKFRQIKETRAINADWSVLDLAFSPDNNSLYYSSWCKNVHVWMLDKPEVIVEMEDEIDPSSRIIGNHRVLEINSGGSGYSGVFALSVSSDGSELACAGNSGSVIFYNTVLDINNSKVRFCSQDINAVKYDPSSSNIVYIAGDNSACMMLDRRLAGLHNSANGVVASFYGHKGGITYIDAKGDGNYIITNSKDQTVKLWDVRKPSPADVARKAKKSFAIRAWDYRFDGCPMRVLQNKTINFEGDTSLLTFQGHAVMQTLIRAKFSPLHNTGQRYVYTGGADGRIFIYDILTGKMIKILESRTRECIRDVSWHPFRNEIYSCSWDYSIVRWAQC